MTFSGSFFGKASRATCGISSIDMNSSVGRLVIPNAVDSSRSSSLFTLYVVLIFFGKAFQCGRQHSARSIKRILYIRMMLMILLIKYCCGLINYIFLLALQNNVSTAKCNKKFICILRMEHYYHMYLIS